jgi:uncharacterized membrane protein AbrB (regulator of aidB expression)
MIEQQTRLHRRAVPQKRTLRPGTTTAFFLIALAAIVAITLAQVPAFAASPGGMLVLATVATAAGLYCHRLFR